MVGGSGGGGGVIGRLAKDFSNAKKLATGAVQQADPRQGPKKRGRDLLKLAQSTGATGAATLGQSVQL